MDTKPVTSLQSQTASSSISAQRAQQIHDVAHQFESLFTNMMLRSMRSTVGDNPLVPTSTGEKIYTDMLDDEYSKLMSNSGSFGLAALVEKQLLKQENISPSDLNALQGLHNTPQMTNENFMPGANGLSSSATSGATSGINRIQKWTNLINKAALKYNVDPHLISSVMATESGGNPLALSAKGAKGLMQLMDTTAGDMGVTQPYSPEDNVFGGAKYLRTLLDKFNGNERLAVASYNAGPAAVQRYGDVPPYVETQQYVDSVMQLRNQLAGLQPSKEIK